VEPGRGGVRCRRRLVYVLKGALRAPGVTQVLHSRRVAWLPAFANRRFSGLLLIWAGVPILLLYVWQALVQPLLFGAELGDFQGSYMRAAARLAAGRAPFDLCPVSYTHLTLPTICSV